MKLKYLLLTLVVIMFIFLALRSKQEWIFSKVVDQTIYFSNGRQFKINLYDLKYIGQLHRKSSIPFLNLAGRGCMECDENLAIYIYSPISGLIKNKGMVVRYSYPGREHDYSENKIIFESRMFYGDCLKNNIDSIVWLQKTLNSQNNFEDSAFVLEPKGEDLKETILKGFDVPIIQTNNKCNELTGMDFSPEP